MPARLHKDGEGEPASPAPAGRRAYDWVRTRVLDGTLPGGTLLSEGEVAEAVGVSRTPVREAFLQLAAEGMLALYPKRGALVVPVSAGELQEVFAARALLEPWAAAAAARREDRRELVQALRAVLAETAKTLESGDLGAYRESDRRFHEEVVAAAGNGLLAGFYSSLHDVQVRGVSLVVHSRPSRPAEAESQHVGILEAIERGDGETAAALARAHVGDTARLLGLSPLE